MVEIPCEIKSKLYMLVSLFLSKWPLGKKGLTVDRIFRLHLHYSQRLKKNVWFTSTLAITHIDKNRATSYPNLKSPIVWITHWYILRKGLSLNQHFPRFITLFNHTAQWTEQCNASGVIHLMYRVTLNSAVAALKRSPPECSAGVE